MEIFFRLLIVVLLILLNGYFVASEFALVAVRKTRIDELVKKGNGSAKQVQKAIEQIDTYISSTQLGITFASLALGWIGEPFLAHLLEPILGNFLPENLSFLTAHALSVAIAFSLITFFHIVIGELTPKSIALQKTESTALLIIHPLVIFTKVFKPFIWLLNEAGNLVLKLIGFTPASGLQAVHSEEEIKMILAQSASEGVIEKAEAEMVYSVFRFGDTPVKQIMIPRTKIIAFDKKSSLQRIINLTQKKSHSRFPIYENSIDNIVGFIHVKDLYKNISSEVPNRSIRDIYKIFIPHNKERNLTDLKVIRRILKVDEKVRIDDLLLEMRRKRVHIAAVTGEGNRTVGMVTMEDVVESLVGEIEDEFEESEENKPLIKRIINL